MLVTLNMLFLLAATALSALDLLDEFSPFFVTSGNYCFFKKSPVYCCHLSIDHCAVGLLINTQHFPASVLKAQTTYVSLCLDMIAADNGKCVFLALKEVHFS